MRALLLATALTLVTTAPAGAQTFGSGEIDRGLSKGAYVPYDGAPFSHRYFYGSGANLYLNGSAERLWYLHYVDRAERAEKFGYEPPPPPHELVPPARPVRVGVGLGFGMRRWR